MKKLICVLPTIMGEGHTRDMGLILYTIPMNKHHGKVS